MNVLLLYIFGALALGFGSATRPIQNRHRWTLVTLGALVSTAYLSLRFV